MLSGTVKSIPKLRFLSAWFCPYAHRATLALEHHHGRVDYEWVEVCYGSALESGQLSLHEAIDSTDCSFF